MVHDTGRLNKFACFGHALINLQLDELTQASVKNLYPDLKDAGHVTSNKRVACFVNKAFVFGKKNKPPNSSWGIGEI